MKQLWLVKIDDDDWWYDRFVAATVWADSGDEAMEIVRAASREGEHSGIYQPNHVKPWIEASWRLTAELAPTDGIALVHWRGASPT